MTRRSKKQENSSNSVNNGDTALKTPDLNSNREESKTVLERKAKTSKLTTRALNHNKHKNNAKPNDILKIISQLPKNNSNKTHKNNDRHKQSRQPKPPRHRKCAQPTKKHQEPERGLGLWAGYGEEFFRIQMEKKNSQINKECYRTSQKNQNNQETDNTIYQTEKCAPNHHKHKISHNSVNNGDRALKTPDLNSIREVSKSRTENHKNRKTPDSNRETSNSRTTYALNHNKHKNSSNMANNGDTTLKTPDLISIREDTRIAENIREAIRIAEKRMTRALDSIKHKNSSTKCEDNHNKHKNSSNSVNNGDTALKTPDLNSIRDVSESLTTCAINHYKHKISHNSLNNGPTALVTPVLNPPRRSPNHHKCKNGSPPAESKSRLRAFEHPNQGNRSHYTNNGDIADFKSSVRTSSGKYQHKAKPNDILQIISQLPKQNKNKNTPPNSNNDSGKETRQQVAPRHRSNAKRPTKKHQKSERKYKSELEVIPEHNNIEFHSTKRMHVQSHLIKLKNSHQYVKSSFHNKQKNSPKKTQSTRAAKTVKKSRSSANQPSQKQVNRQSQYEALRDSWVEFFDECYRQHIMTETQKTPDLIPKQPQSVRPKKKFKKSRSTVSSQNQSNRQARSRTKPTKPICRPRSKTPKRNKISSSSTTPKKWRGHEYYQPYSLPATTRSKTKSQLEFDNFIRESDLQLEKARSDLAAARVFFQDFDPSPLAIAQPVPLEERKADCLSMSDHPPDSSAKGHSDENKTRLVSSSWKRPHCFSDGYSSATHLLEEINQTKIHMLQHLHPIALTPAAVTPLVFPHATVLAQSINCIIFPPRLFMAAHKLSAPVVSTFPLDSLYKETPFRITGPGPPLGDSMSKFFGFLFEFFLSFLNDLKCPISHTDDCMIK
jgi:hypothetical protein